MMSLVNFFTYLFHPFRQSPSRTVRLAFPLTFMAIALLGAQAITSQNTSGVIIESSATTLKAGDTFNFTVYVNAHREINAVDLEIKYPKERMEVIGIDTGESVITLWTADPYAENGVVYLRGGTFRRGFIGRHRIARVQARAIESGIAQINVDDVQLLAGDGSGTRVDVDDTTTDPTKLYIADENGQFAPEIAREAGAATLTGTAEIVIVTDIDGDGEVTLVDVSRFMSAWFDKSIIFDFNGDGKMTFRDFGIILSDSFFK